MSRAYDISDFAAFLRKYGDSGRDSESRTEEPSRDASQRTRPDRGRNQESTLSRNGYDRSRTIYRCRNRGYSLRGSEVQTLTDLGKFRMVPADDLAQFAYRGDRTQMESDIRSLSRQGLIEQRSIEGHSSYSTKVLTLTKDGHRLLEREQLVSNRQTIYHGMVKPKEARHDADLYRLYHKVAREIADVGGKVRRVVLDYELKQELYRKLSRVDPNKDLAYERIRVANEYDLKVVNDKIPVPDLRIEYEDEFLKFIQAKPGKRSIAFARKVTEKKHATSKEYLRNGRVYHLFSRNLYEAIGRDNVRFRRKHSTEYIRARLIAFDFILKNHDYTYLESEEQKLRYFCDQLGIDKKILPARRYSGAIKDNFTDRYFVDKFPMFYNPKASPPPVVTFSFIDPGFESLDSFKTHVDAYLTLFMKLP